MRYARGQGAKRNARADRRDYVIERLAADHSANIGSRKHRFATDSPLEELLVRLRRNSARCARMCRYEGNGRDGAIPSVSGADLCPRLCYRIIAEKLYRRARSRQRKHCSLLLYSSGLVGALADIIADLTPDLAVPGVQRPAAPGCGTAPRPRHRPRYGEEPGSEGGGEKFGGVQSSCG